MIAYFLALLISNAGLCQGFPYGAPEEACESMEPDHFFGPQDTEPPYWLEVTTDDGCQFSGKVNV